MKFSIDGMQYNFEGIDLKAFNEIWIRETKKIFGLNRYIHYVEINGQQHYEGYEAAIVNGFNNIHTIHMQSIDESELVGSSLQELFSYNKKLIPACNSIGSLFYGEMSEGDWHSFVALMDGVQWLYSQIQGLSSVLSKSSHFPELIHTLQNFENSIGDILKEIESSIEAKDHTHLADIITYELSEIFIELDEQLNEVSGVIQ